MNLKNQKNGNDQLNSIRNEFNDRVKKSFFQGMLQEYFGLVQEGLEQSKIRYTHECQNQKHRNR